MGLLSRAGSWLAAAFISVSSLTGCVFGESTRPLSSSSPIRLKNTTFDKLPGWDSDHHSEVLAAFARSCERILQEPARKAFNRASGIGGTYGDWQPACEDLKNVPPGDDAKAREYFEKWFRPWSVASPQGDTTGLFTGYYEASLHGSRTRSERYRYPVLRVPPGFQNGRWSRKDIMEGNWPYNTQDHAIVWVDSVVDLVFLQIQGSGSVTLDDGTTMRVGYDGQNGFSYYAIGRELVKQGIPPEQVTMQTIRDWLTQHPDQALDIIYKDNSYVFFRETNPNEGPKGAEGVPLTPERSLAVDHRYVPYGLPIWVDIDEVLRGEGSIRRLVVGQDTGGAIRIENGLPARGDLFWGAGPRAEQGAGPMQSQGRYWFLLPRHLK